MRRDVIPAGARHGECCAFERIGFFRLWTTSHHDDGAVFSGLSHRARPEIACGVDGAHAEP